MHHFSFLAVDLVTGVVYLAEKRKKGESSTKAKLPLLIFIFLPYTFLSTETYQATCWAASLVQPLATSLEIRKY